MYIPPTPFYNSNFYGGGCYPLPPPPPQHHMEPAPPGVVQGDNRDPRPPQHSYYQGGAHGRVVMLFYFV